MTEERLLLAKLEGRVSAAAVTATPTPPWRKRASTSQGSLDRLKEGAQKKLREAQARLTGAVSEFEAAWQTLETALEKGQAEDKGSLLVIEALAPVVAEKAKALKSLQLLAGRLWHQGGRKGVLLLPGEVLLNEWVLTRERLVKRSRGPPGGTDEATESEDGSKSGSLLGRPRGVEKNPASAAFRAGLRGEKRRRCLEAKVRDAETPSLPGPVAIKALDS